MTPPQIPIAWFYVVSKEAAPVFQKIIATGVGPGTVATISDEDFETLRDGMICIPIHARPQESKILTMPTAS